IFLGWQEYALNTSSPKNSAHPLTSHSGFREPECFQPVTAFCCTLRCPLERVLRAGRHLPASSCLVVRYPCDHSLSLRHPFRQAIRTKGTEHSVWLVTKSFRGFAND